jgi:acyl-CoA hydrolase
MIASSFKVGGSKGKCVEDFTIKVIEALEDEGELVITTTDVATPENADKVIVQLFTFNTSVHVKVQIFFLHRE